jgi:hypothetical protein
MHLIIVELTPESTAEAAEGWFSLAVKSVNRKNEGIASVIGDRSPSSFVSHRVDRSGRVVYIKATMDLIESLGQGA